MPGVTIDRDGPLVLAGFVPDGVATVSVAYRTGRTSAQVGNNFFRVLLPTRTVADSIRWYDAGGKTIRTVDHR